MPKILIVDDDESFRRIYARYLSAEGFEVFQAPDIEAAASQTGTHEFDAILLDMRMPSAHGRDLLPELRRSQPRARIMVTSCYDVDYQRRNLSGVEEYFNKAEGCRALSKKLKAVLT